MQGNNAANKLAETLNSYFVKKPYSWFGNFEKVLSLLNAGYYENKANTAIHIDIYSAIATTPTWGGLTECEKQDIRRTDLFQKLLKLLNPDVIVFSVNQKVFNEVFHRFECVKSIDDIGGKKGFFIRKYTYGGKILISGRNYRGQPFGGMSDAEIKQTIKQLL